MFSVLREVEKEVVLLDQIVEASNMVPESREMPTDPSSIGPEHAPHQTGDSLTAVSGPRVLKVIRKAEVQVLCNQHNPVRSNHYLYATIFLTDISLSSTKAVAAAKKASKQDKIRNDLVALPPMTRIKIRVSAGVFEVSLIRVIEAAKSVEVLWDRGVKREFKWGSVVFGSTDGQTVLQKPSELAPEPGRKLTRG